jgi:hypothetical protein
MSLLNILCCICTCCECVLLDSLTSFKQVQFSSHYKLGSIFVSLIEWDMPPLWVCVQSLFLPFSDSKCGHVVQSLIFVVIPTSFFSLLTSKYPGFIYNLIVFTGHGLFGTILSMTSCFWSVSPLYLHASVLQIHCILILLSTYYIKAFVECWNRFNCKFMVGSNEQQWFWTWQVSILTRC